MSLTRQTVSQKGTADPVMSGAVEIGRGMAVLAGVPLSLPPVCQYMQMGA
jgi:hypothetical protein